MEFVIKKFIPILLIMCICFALGGCSGEEEKKPGICGSEQVEALRAAAAGWESGRYLFTDLLTGETNQVFSFMYNADGTQIYLYEKVIDGVYYAEYNDGTAIYILDGETISIVRPGSDGFVSYSRDNPHPYSTGDLLFYVKEYIGRSEEIPLEQNAVAYEHYYNTDKMNKATGSVLTNFAVSYTFDADGNFLYFTQNSFDGENSSSYMIETVDENSVTAIDNPVTIP